MIDVMILKCLYLIQMDFKDCVCTFAASSLGFLHSSPETTIEVRTIADPISSKRAAVHHVSQAIKSLRWTRQLQGVESEFVNDETMQHPATYV